MKLDNRFQVHLRKGIKEMVHNVARLIDTLLEITFRMQEHVAKLVLIIFAHAYGYLTHCSWVTLHL